MVGTPKTRAEVRAALIQVLETLTNEMPVPHPVFLRLAAMRECYGSCDFRDTNKSGKHFLITIHPPPDPITEEGFVVCRETLLHEFSHAMSWSTASSDGGHGESWGCCYAAAYRAVHGD